MNVTCVKRIMMPNGVVVYSKTYTRTKLRINYFVLIDDGNVMIGSVNEYVIIGEAIFALVDIHDIDSSFSTLFEGGKHLFKIKNEFVRKLVNVKYIKEKLFFLGLKHAKFIAKMPNLFGRNVVL